MPIDFNEAANMRKDVMNVNTGDLGNDPRRARRLSSSLKKCSPFGKAWEVGDQGTVFYPFKWYPDATRPDGGTFELHASIRFGHAVSDMKLIGHSFLPSMSIIDACGNVVGSGDLAYQFSRIARILVNAQKEAKLAAVNNKDWSLLGNAAYTEARKKVEDEFDSKNMNSVKPLIGRLNTHTVTELIYVQMDPNSGTPIFNDERKRHTGNYVQVVKEGRMSKLLTLANDPTYGIRAQNPGMVPEEGKLYFLEVLYNFTSATNNKADAGKADPQGVAPNLTIVSRFPEHQKTLEDLLGYIPETPEGIAAHTYDAAPMSEDVLRTKLQQYMFNLTSDLAYLSPDDQSRLVKNAALFDYLRIAPREAPELCSRMEQELGHAIGQVVDGQAPTLDTIMAPGADAPDFSMQPVNSHDNVQIPAEPGDLSSFDTSIGDEDDLLGGAPVDLTGGL